MDLLKFFRANPLAVLVGVVAVLATWPLWLPLAIAASFFAVPAVLVGLVGRARDLWRSVPVDSLATQVLAGLAPKKSAAQGERSDPAA